MVSVIPLASQHVETVAHLHLKYLRTSFRGYFGLQLLKCYYEIMLNSDAACGYVAVEKDDVAGFVCGVWNPERLRSALLKQHLPKLLFWGSLQVLVRPTMLVQFADRFFSSTDDNEKLAHVGYELRPIVVDSRFRGTGTAEHLVHYLIQDAAQRGFKKLFLYTEDDNAAANAFYRKVGFVHIGKHEIGRSAYYRYEILTGKKIL